MLHSLADRLTRRMADAALRLIDLAHDHRPDHALSALAANLPPGPPDLRDALEQLLRACAEEADLSPLGRLALRWDIDRRIANLRRLDQAEADNPEIPRTPIGAPLVITGMPRSGTTFLHQLIAADPQSLVPRCWETLYPYPDPGRHDRRAARVDRQLRRFAWLAPGVRGMHPLDSAAPQECTEITAQVFQSLRYETLYNIPSYKTWLTRHGHTAAYRFHRRFLQHLQSQRPRPGRWVLKCPDHVFALDALRAVYPDARVVFMHRDPAQVLASVARLTSVLRAPFTRRVDPTAIGRQIFQDWGCGADIMAREATHPTFPADRVLHLAYRDVASRPVETVRRIYTHFGLPWSRELEARIAARATAEPNGGYTQHDAYDLASHGIELDAVQARFAAYIAACVSPTAEAAASRPRAPAHAGP